MLDYAALPALQLWKKAPLNQIEATRNCHWVINQSREKRREEKKSVILTKSPIGFLSGKGQNGPGAVRILGVDKVQTLEEDEGNPVQNLSF